MALYKHDCAYSLTTSEGHGEGGNGGTNSGDVGEGAGCNEDLFAESGALLGGSGAIVMCLTVVEVGAHAVLDDGFAGGGAGGGIGVGSSAARGHGGGVGAEGEGVDSPGRVAVVSLHGGGDGGTEVGGGLVGGSSASGEVGADAVDRSGGSESGHTGGPGVGRPLGGVLGGARIRELAVRALGLVGFPEEATELLGIVTSSHGGGNDGGSGDLGGEAGAAEGDEGSGSGGSDTRGSVASKGIGGGGSGAGGKESGGEGLHVCKIQAFNLIIIFFVKGEFIILISVNF